MDSILLFKCTIKRVFHNHEKGMKNKKLNLKIKAQKQIFALKHN